MVVYIIVVVVITIMIIIVVVVISTGIVSWYRHKCSYFYEKIVKKLINRN